MNFIINDAVKNIIRDELFFSVGGGLNYLYDADNVVRPLIMAKEIRPDWFYEQIKISSIFDSFAGLIWSGGRKLGNPVFSFTEMQERVTFFNSRLIGVYFTFTNSKLTEKHFDDEICNKILQACENHLNGVIVNNELLRRYIRKNYPQYKLIHSLTSGIRDKEELMALTKIYDLVVIPPEFNKDLEFLRALPRDKIELMINDCCVPYCQYRREHTDAISMSFLNDKSAEDKYLIYRQQGCRYPSNTTKGELTLNLKEIFEIFRTTGITQFKFSNRVGSFATSIRMLNQYLVKEIYQKEFSVYARALAEAGTKDKCNKSWQHGRSAAGHGPKGLIL
jgi:collagenase-like PrtC family protease